MRAERAQFAERYRAEGRKEADAINAKTDAEKTVLLAEARKSAEESRGKAEAEVAHIYSAAHQEQPDLYRFLRELETLKKVVNQNTNLVLDCERAAVRFAQSTSAAIASEAGQSMKRKREDALFSAHAILAALRSSIRVLRWGMLVLVLIYLCSGITMVKPNERALILRFGRALPKSAPPGLLFAFPAPIDEVIMLPAKTVQEVSLDAWGATSARFVSTFSPSRARFLHSYRRHQHRPRAFCRSFSCGRSGRV